MINSRKFQVVYKYPKWAKTTQLTNLGICLVGDCLLCTMHGKSPLNYNLGEYVWNFFQASNKQIQQKTIILPSKCTAVAPGKFTNPNRKVSEISIIFRGELLNFRAVLLIQQYELLCIKVRISSITGGKVKLSLDHFHKESPMIPTKVKFTTSLLASRGAARPHLSNMQQKIQHFVGPVGPYQL